MTLPMTMTKYDAVALPPARRTELLEELATTLADRDRIKMHNEEIAKKAKEILKSRELRIKELTDQLVVNSESVARACTIEYDFLQNTTTIKDAKTKDIVETRAMTVQERTELQDEKDALRGAGDDQPFYGNKKKRR